MNFSKALELIKAGFAITRKGWNGKGMFVKFEMLFTGDRMPIANPCLILWSVNKEFNTWIPSVTDLFAEDWEIYR